MQFSAFCKRKEHSEKCYVKTLLNTKIKFIRETSCKDVYKFLKSVFNLKQLIILIKEAKVVDVAFFLILIV